MAAAVSTLLAAVVPQLSGLTPEHLDCTQTYWSEVSHSNLAECFDLTTFRSLGEKTAWNPAGALRDRWNTELLPIVKDILDDPGNYEYIFEKRSKHPRATYHLYMVGEQMKWQYARPTIVVICVKNRIAKRIIRLLKSLKAFKDLKLGFDFLAYKAKVSFHAGNAKNEHFSEQPSTLCGSRVVMSPFPLPHLPLWSQATIGGLVLLEGTFYGLTIAHAFCPDKLTDDETESCSSSSGTDEMSDVDENKIKSRRSSQPIVRGAEVSQAYTVYLKGEVAASNPVSNLLEDLTFVGTLTPTRSSLLAAIDPTESNEMRWLSREMDWALVRIETPQFWAPNEIQTPGGKTLHPKALFLGHTPPKHKVLAMAGVSGIFESKCSDTMCGIMLPGSKTMQYAWTMNTPSRPGNCGTWIVDADNGDVCGSVVACCEELSMTYVLPMKSIWESIRCYHQEVDLPLATRSNRETSVENHGIEETTRLVQDYEAAYRSIGMVDVKPVPKFLESKLCVECARLGLFCDANFMRCLPCSRCTHNGYSCISSSSFKPDMSSNFPNTNSVVSSHFKESRRFGLSDAWLRQAAANGHEATVKVLLDKGADVNAVDDSQRTALMGAARFWHEKVVQLLLERGADFDSKTEDGWTALHIASARGYEDIVEQLLKRGADIKSEVEFGQTALHIASVHGYKDIVEQLLKRGAYIGSRDEFGWTALHIASARGYKDIVEQLLKRGAYLELRVEFGWTALHFALAYGHKDIVEQLLKRGADIESKDDDGWTALHITSAHGYEDIVEQLLKRGADRESKIEDGRTALQIASAHGYENIVEQLLKRGADIESKTKDGHTAL